MTNVIRQYHYKDKPPQLKSADYYGRFQNLWSKKHALYAYGKEIKIHMLVMSSILLIY